MEKQEPKLNSYGTCALCGKECNLTFEHIPPKAAFNSRPLKVYNGDSLIETVTGSRKPWDLSGLKYNNQQRGMGYYSLCGDCNSYTGTFYGEAYKNVADSFAGALLKTGVKANETLHCKIEMKPLAFIKQVLSMFCSINRDISNLSEIKQFVLDKDKMGLPKNEFRLGMYLSTGGLTRVVPHSTMLLEEDEKRVKSLNVTEISSFPMGFVLFFGNSEGRLDDFLDITMFSEIPYEKSCVVELDIPVYDINTMFPLDYRTKEEINISIQGK